MYGTSFWGEGTLLLAEADRDAAAQHLADYAPAGVLATFVGEAVSGVLVERGIARALDRVYQERQGVGGLLADVIYLGP